MQIELNNKPGVDLGRASARKRQQSPMPGIFPLMLEG